MARQAQDHPGLQLLAELHLQYRKDKARVTAGAPRVGAYLGSGTGKAIGLATGEIEGTFFEAQGEPFAPPTSWARSRQNMERS